MQSATQSSIDFNDKSLGKTFPLDIGDVVSLRVAGLKLVARPGKPEAPASSVTVANDLPKPVVATSGPIIIGRQASCDLIIFDSCMSREHASLRVHDNVLMVRDLGSTNGTFVNGKRISQEAAIKVGDIVSFDTYRFGVIALPQMHQPIPVDARTVLAPHVENLIPRVPIPASIPAGQPIAAVLLEKAPAPKLDAPPAVVAAVAPKLEKPDAEKIEIPALVSPKLIADTPRTEKPSREGNKDPERTPAPESTAKKPAAETADDEGAPWWEQQKKRNRTIFGGALAEPDTQPDRGELPAVDGPALLGLTPPFKGQVFPLREGTLTLGRATNNEMVIDAAQVSDKHAQMVGSAGSWKVVNLLSSNGTFVNGERCVSRYLQSGDLLRLGNVSFRFVNNTTSSVPKNAVSKKLNAKLLGSLVAVLVVLVIAAVLVFLIPLPI